MDKLTAKMKGSKKDKNDIPEPGPSGLGDSTDQNPQGNRTSRPASASSSRRDRESRAASESSFNRDDKSVSSDNALFNALQGCSDVERERVEFTIHHPLGKILTDLYMDNLYLAEKTGLREVNSNLKSLCDSFYTSMSMESECKKAEKQETILEIENAILQKELNSHLLKQEFAVPTYFSPVPVINSLSFRSECLKNFPVKGTKFSGSDEKVSVIEFLNSINYAQKQCKLSEPEFLNMLLMSTTGFCHSLLIDWIASGVDAATIYHNLMIYFDKRMSAEDAQKVLYSFKAGNYMNLAKVEAKIMNWTTRACANLPPGQSKVDNYNNMANMALIRCMPPASALQIQNSYNLLSAKLGRHCTFAELTKAINIYRQQIDLDIKQNGIAGKYQSNDKKHNYKQKGQNGPNTYSGTVQQDTGYRGRGNGGNRGNGRGNGNRGSGRGNGGSGYRGNNYRGQRGNYRGRGNNGYRGNGRNNTQDTSNYCNMCGQTGHTATGGTGCKNMVADNGKHISMFPSFNTCSACPPQVEPRLNHPEGICPYRVGAPLHGTM